MKTNFLNFTMPIHRSKMLVVAMALCAGSGAASAQTAKKVPQNSAEVLPKPPERLNAPTLREEILAFGVKDSTPKPSGGLNAPTDWDKAMADGIRDASAIRADDSVAVTAIIHTPIAQDPLQSLTPPDAVQGLLVYGIMAVQPNLPGPTGRFIALRRIGNTKDGSTGGTEPLTYYQLENTGTDYLMGTEFLPGGRSILFKLGRPFSSHGNFQLFVLDLDQQKVRRVSKSLIVNEDVQISPNGKFVCYIANVDRLGNSNGWESPSLTVVNIETGEQKVVASGLSLLFGHWSWTSQNSLLFAMLPSELRAAQPPIVRKPQGKATSTAKKTTAKTSPPKLAEDRPAIYEVSEPFGKPRLVVRDAWRPLPSPDSQWIAFFGAEDPKNPEPLSQHWNSDPKGATLSVVKHDGSGRKPLNREQGNYPRLQWKEDSKYLIAAKILRNGVQSAADMKQYDLATGKFSTLPGLQTADAQVFPRPLDTLPPFDLNGLSKDGTYLITKASTIGEQAPITMMYDRFDFLAATNIKDGTVEEIVKLKNAWGLDWLDTSSSTK